MQSDRLFASGFGGDPPTGEAGACVFRSQDTAEATAGQTDFPFPPTTEQTFVSPPDAVHLFLSLRSLHILAAALWVGAASFISLILFPALGRGAPEMIARLVRARLPIYMAGAGATTVLSGLFLYWYVFSAGGLGSRAAWVFGIAGTFGLGAAIIGRGVVGKSAARIARLFEQGSNQSRGALDRATVEAIVVLQNRMQRAGKAHLVLMVVALLLMSLGHYL